MRRALRRPCAGPPAASQDLQMSHNHAHAHAHGHGHGSRPTPQGALLGALLLNGGFLVLEAAVGWWTNSLALLSDALHMVSDVGALAIALFAVRMSERKPSESFTFGMRRAPVLGGLLNAVVLVITVLFILIEAAERLRDPPSLRGIPIFVTGLAGLLINLASAWYLARSQDTSVNTRGAMLHLLADALGSVAALASAAAVWFWGFALADPIASAVIGVLIVVGTWPLLRDSLRILLQSTPAGMSSAHVQRTLEARASVISVDDLHIWELDSGQPILTAVLTINESDMRKANALCDEIRTLLRSEFSIEHATLECRHADEARFGCGVT